MDFKFEVIKKSKKLDARGERLYAPHGTINTPVLTPGKVLEIQIDLGSDIMMPLDACSNVLSFALCPSRGLKVCKSK